MIWDETTDFPENNWYLEIDDENRELVNNWRINIIKYSNKPCYYNYINWDGGGLVWGWGGIEAGGLVLICTSQFKKYVLKEKGFVLPEKWCIKATKENTEILNDFIKNHKYQWKLYTDAWKIELDQGDTYLHYPAEFYSDGHSSDKIKNGYTKITFEQFKEHVLRKKEQQKNYDYLIPFLKKLNIK